MAGNILTEFILTTPPITRILTGLVVLVTLLIYMNVIEPHQLSYSRYYLLKGQLARIFTSFLYFGSLNVELVIHIVFFYRYSVMLEESFGKTSDYFFMLFVIFILLFITSTVFYIPFLGASLSSTITYIWTRKNPRAVVQMMGFLTFYAFYLPFIVPAFTLLFEGKISAEEIVGICVGHLVYYFQDVYPRFGRAILKTPCWCHKLFNERDECCRIKPTHKKSLRELRGSNLNKNNVTAPKEEDIGGDKINNTPPVADIVKSVSSIIKPSEQVKPDAEEESISTKEDFSDFESKSLEEDEIEYSKDIDVPVEMENQVVEKTILEDSPVEQKNSSEDNDFNNEQDFDYFEEENNIEYFEDEKNYDDFEDEKISEDFNDEEDFVYEKNSENEKHVFKHNEDLGEQESFEEFEEIEDLSNSDQTVNSSSDHNDKKETNENNNENESAYVLPEEEFVSFEIPENNENIFDEDEFESQEIEVSENENIKDEENIEEMVSLDKNNTEKTCFKEDLSPVDLNEKPVQNNQEVSDEWESDDNV